MQDKENLTREQKRILAENQYLQGRIENLDSGTNEDGPAKANSKIVSKSKTKKCQVDLKSVRVTDENLNPARKKPNDDR